MTLMREMNATLPDMQRPHPRQQLGELERLREVVVGPEPQGRDCRIYGAVPGDDDALGRKRVLLRPAENFEPVHVRHFDVQQCDVERGLPDGAERRATIGTPFDPVPSALEVPFQQAGDDVVVFSNQNTHVNCRKH